MCVVPNYDQKHIKYPNPTKKCRATGSKDILQHWKLSVHEVIWKIFAQNVHRNFMFVVWDRNYAQE